MKLFVTERAKKDLKKLDKSTLKRINEALHKLLTNPYIVDLKKLKGEANKWRLRVGSHRIILTMNWKEEAIYVLRVLHRRKAY